MAKRRKSRPADDARYNASLKGRFRVAKRRAKETGIGFDLTLSEYKFLVNEEPCFYCGKEIGKTVGYSLDRLDSFGPYDVVNAVACCKSCNSIKGDKLNPEEMLAVAKLLNFLRDSK